MTQPLTGLETQYRNIVNRIAVALLVFYGFFNVYTLMMSYVVPFFTTSLSSPLDIVVYEIVNGVFYAIAFLIPVGVFWLISRRTTRIALDTQLALPREAPLYIFAVVALVSAAGYVNTKLLDVFDYSAFTEQMLFDMGAKTNVELILTLFTLCIVPAFVEELLFRGVILKQLLPFGKTTAVLASALLFGIMHQNAGQLLYATVAGIAFGYVMVQTRSLWCCILIHFCNNFWSLFTSTIAERLPQSVSTPILLCAELVVLALGLAAAVFLAIHAKRAPSAEVDDAILPLTRRGRLFFTPPMVIYMALCLAQIALLLLLALLL